MSRFEGPRGLVGYARIETAEQQVVEVQQSSAVLSMTINGEAEGPFVWLRVFRSGNGTFAHLSVADARELRDALRAWLEDFTGEGTDREPKELCRATPERHNPLEPSGLSCRLAYGHRGYHHDGNWAWPESNSAARREPSDAELIDLWWKTCEDAWAIPDELMVKFGRAVLLAAQEARRNG